MLMEHMKKYFRSVSVYRIIFQEVFLIIFFTILFSFENYNLYFADLCLGLERAECILLCLVACVAIQLLVELNPRFMDRDSGIILETLLISELPCFFLFAQYHLWIALALLLAAFGGLFALNHKILEVNRRGKKPSAKLRFWCWHRSTSLMTYILCAALVVPAIVGYYEEYINHSLSDEEWTEFVEWYNDCSTQGENGASQALHYEEKISGLLEWDSLTVAEKERTIRAIAMIEKESLGIADDVEICVYTEKMHESTCGYYLDFSNEIFINYKYLNEGEPEDVIRTILHEMHHAFVYYTIDTIDFEAEQGGEFYERAKEWDYNADHYIEASVDFYGYLEQPIEFDARTYAAERDDFYLNYINSHQAE